MNFNQLFIREYTVDDFEYKGISNIIVKGKKGKYERSISMSLELNYFFEKVVSKEDIGKYLKDDKCDLLVSINIKDIGIKSKKRKQLYNLYNFGFEIGGNSYKRYKRSSGSSREGKCLFILDKYYDAMNNWSNAGLDTPENDLKIKENIASWESYRALTLSSVIDTIDLKLENFLFMDDYYSIFDDEVINVYCDKEKAKTEAKREVVRICNNIWDGESLIDESIFPQKYKNNEKSMLLLRNKFFKSCAFRANIQDFFSLAAKKQNKEKLDISDLNGITFASDISDIKIIITDSSLKFLKFGTGDKKEIIKKWFENCRNGSENVSFGIVKYDKKQKYFHGDMVQTSYQLINTLPLNEGEVAKLLSGNENYFNKILSLKKSEIDTLGERIKWHFNNYSNIEEILDDDEDYNDDSNEEQDAINDYDIISRQKIIRNLLDRNSTIAKTKYVRETLSDTIKQSIKERLKKGKMLVTGTYATMLGNGPELLKATVGKNYISIGTKKAYAGDVELLDNNGESRIYCKKFLDGEKVVGARNPHITMGNLLITKNCLNNNFISTFFPHISDEIVCVNSINNNIQQRLNGCDFDSDTVLLTNDIDIVTAAEKKGMCDFLVPYNNIDSTTNMESSDISSLLCDLDLKIANNNIGIIVNLSQKLNSILWDKYNKTNVIDVDIYNDICKLAVFSGVEIDSAKKTFEAKFEEKEFKKYKPIVEEATEGKIYTQCWPIFFRKKPYNTNEYKTAMSFMYKLVSEKKYIGFSGHGGKGDLILDFLEDDSKKRSDDISDIKAIIFTHIKDFAETNSKRLAYINSKSNDINLIYTLNQMTIDKSHCIKKVEEIINNKRVSIYSLFKYIEKNKGRMKVNCNSSKGEEGKEKKKTFELCAYDVLFSIDEVINSVIKNANTKHIGNKESDDYLRTIKKQ